MEQTTSTMESPHRLRIDVETSEPVEIRADFNAISKATRAYMSRLVRAGVLREFKGQSACPLAVLWTLLEMLAARESATLFTQSNRILVWPSYSTLENRTAYSRRSLERAAAWLEKQRIVNRFARGGGADSTLYELLPQSEEDCAHYWGGRVPNKRRAARPAPPASNGRGTPASNGRGTPASNDRGTPASRGGTPRPAEADVLIGIKENEAAAEGNPGAAAAGAALVDQMRAEGIPLTLALKLAAEPFNTPARVRAAARQARIDRPNDQPRRIRVLIWMLTAADNFTAPPASTPAAADVAAEAERRRQAQTAAHLAWEARHQRERIAALAAAGQLARLVALAVAEAPNEFMAGLWGKVRADDAAAVAKNSTLTAAVLALADSKGLSAPPPPPPPGLTLPTPGSGFVR